MQNMREGLAIHLLQFMLCAIWFSFSGPTPTTVAQEHLYLEQGWSSEDREWFYYTTQGSRLIPYDWFVALEQPDDNTLFSDRQHLSTFGFLYADESERNPSK